MGNRNSYKYATFEDIQSNRYMIINTLPLSEQNCLIKNTLRGDMEENIINSMLDNEIEKKNIIIYGKNYMDESVYKKYEQLVKLGFDVKIYVSGMFEWMLLQEVYGSDNFPTTTRELDILKFKPQQAVSQHTASIGSGNFSDSSLCLT